MEKVQRYLYSNLYLFLPSLLILLALAAFFTFFEPDNLEHYATRFSECDFTAGGGSLNLCRNRIYVAALLPTVGGSTVLAFLITAGLTRLLKIAWLSPLFGIAAFYGIPALLFGIHGIFTAGIYGEPRGRITDTIITFGSITFIIFVVVGSYINCQKYTEHNFRQSRMNNN